MKTLILATFAVLSLGVGAANAASLNTAAPQQGGSQTNWLSVGAGWG